jgi:heavy metal translocating P-type ATPase
MSAFLAMSQEPPSIEAAANLPSELDWASVWTRVGIAVVLAGQGMVFSLAANLTPPEGAAYWLVHGGLIASAVGVFALLGPALVRETWVGIRAGRATVDALFLVTLLGAFVASLIASVSREGAVFYEVVAILLAIYTVGKALAARSRARALNEVGRAREAYGRCLVELPDGVLESRPVEAVAAGDRVMVGPGERFTVDGMIAAGRGYVEETAVTGEPTPLVRGPGDRALAGMRSVDGVFTVQVTSAGGRRMLDQLLATIERARLAPSRLQQQADRLTSWFLPITLTVSAGTFLFWLPRSGLAIACFNSMAVLLVSCPCAMGLATPMAIWGGLLKLGRRGVAARSADFIDQLAAVDRVIFDKTGTLFHEELAVDSVEVEPEFAGREEWLRRVVACAERGNSHPVARSLSEIPAGRDGSFPPASVQLLSARQRAGLGVEAEVAVDGERVQVRVGERDFARFRPESAGGVAIAAEPGGKQVYVAINECPAASIGLRERPRRGAAEAFAQLEQLGIAAEILTGDPGFSPAMWPEVKRRSGASPEEKVSHVQRLQATGAHVLFVGDGLNDAAAMSVAAVSLAMNQGADLARSSAGGVMSGESMVAVPEAIRLARAIRTSIGRNLRFAAAYNAIGMALAATGNLHPVVAALLMVSSSAFVSARSLRAGGPLD